MNACKFFTVVLLALLVPFTEGVAGGLSSVAQIAEVHSVQIEENKVCIVGTGFLEFRAMTDAENQTEDNRVFGQPAQVVRIRAEKATFTIIPYFSDPEIRGVPTGGHSKEELEGLSRKWWADFSPAYRRIQSGDRITIGFQEDRIVLTGFQVESVVGAGSVTIEERPEVD